LKVYLTAHEPSGLFVLCGALSPEDGELVTEAHVRRITQMLARDFAYVVVDTAAGLDEAALAALDEATDIVLMTSLDVTSVRSLGKEVQALDRAGLLNVKRHFVLNRADSKVGIEVGDVEAALGMKADASIPSARAVPFTMNQGRPVVLESPNEKVAQEITRFARTLAGTAAGAAKPSGEKGRGLPWRRKA
jgi:pilus assembly protein CpaE